jgi:hypothetical protein
MGEQPGENRKKSILQDDEDGTIPSLPFKVNY